MKKPSFKTVSAIALASALVVGAFSPAMADSEKSKTSCKENQQTLVYNGSTICVASGASAYQIYVAITNPATPLSLDLWLASLKGTKGDTGAAGTKGDKGNTGEKGDTGSSGADGKDANIIGSACSYSYSSDNAPKTITGTWGYYNANKRFAAYGCVAAISHENGNDD